MAKKQEIIIFDDKSFVGNLIAENDNHIKLYEFEEIPYIQDNFYDIKKEFPNFEKPIGEFLNHTYVMFDKDDNIIYEDC